MANFTMTVQMIIDMILAASRNYSHDKFYLEFSSQNLAVGIKND